jgi:hypothetical protein
VEARNVTPESIMRQNIPLKIYISHTLNTQKNRCMFPAAVSS